MLARSVMSLLILLNALTSLAHADRFPPPEEQVFARAKVIVDVSISRSDTEGYVALKVHEYLRGAGVPREVRGNAGRRKIEVTTALTSVSW